MYVDRPIVGGGPSCSAPTLDGVLSALGSVNRDHALACLEQLRDPSRFAAPFGLRYLPAAHPSYQPEAYWRGPAWPQLEFLAIRACRRWGLEDLAEELAAKSKQAIQSVGLVRVLEPRDGSRSGSATANVVQPGRRHVTHIGSWRLKPDLGQLFRLLSEGRDGCRPQTLHSSHGHRDCRGLEADVTGSTLGRPPARWANAGRWCTTATPVPSVARARKRC